MTRMKSEIADDLDVSSASAQPIDIKMDPDSSIGNYHEFTRIARGEQQIFDGFVDLTADE